MTAQSLWSPMLCSILYNITLTQYINMQIQRWQSLFLLIAAALLAVINFIPVAVSSAGALLYVTQWPIVMIVGILTAVLLFVDIFLFNNLKKQMLVANVAIVLLLLFAFLAGKFALDNAACTPWCYAALAYVVALVLTIAARRFMRRDFNLLRSADRLR
jgi:hypothetical protein